MNEVLGRVERGSAERERERERKDARRGKSGGGGGNEHREIRTRVFDGVATVDGLTGSQSLRSPTDLVLPETLFTRPSRSRPPFRRHGCSSPLVAAVVAAAVVA